MLLRREVLHGCQVISLRGPVTDTDAESLRVAIADAVALAPRGVVVDLSGADEISSAALDVLRAARAAAPGWPRPALVVCASCEEVTEALRSWLPVHPHRDAGLAHIDDRSEAPRATMHLDASPCSPAKARALAADLELGPLADDVALVVSELVTNAIRHAAPPVELEIETGEHAVVVAVADSSAARPVARHAAEDAEGGRGLELIDLVAAESGVRPDPPGKTVWAAFPRP